jgi:lysozyme
MQTSELGKAEIKRHEGLRLTAYDDGAGNLTIGYGHLIRSDMPNQIAREEAERLFLADLATAEAAVNRLVQVPLTSAQYDALVSLVFNWGAGNFAQSELLRRLNVYDYTGAQARLREHPVTAGGQVMAGLQRRRRAEADWFAREGIYTREELAAMGYSGRNPTGTPEPPTPTEPTPGAEQPTPGTQAGNGGLGNWLWLLIGGALLAFVVLSSED